MSRFQINDMIELTRFNQAIKKGIITKGPYKIHGVDHYVVKWEWDEDGIQWINMESDIICDLPSAKYRYRLCERPDESFSIPTESAIQNLEILRAVLKDKLTGEQ